ncbi:MAG: zf-HC2 domain-containing protein [Candidatus Coatesbacteria bacterium]
MKSAKQHCRHAASPDCRKVRDEVFHLLDGRLTAARRRAIQGHLEACPACFSRLEFARIMRQVVRQRVLAEQCPASLVKRIRVMIARDCRPVRGR